MSLSERSSERTLHIPPPGTTTWLAVIAVCFVVLHFLAIRALLSAPASDAGAAFEPALLLSGD